MKTENSNRWTDRTYQCLGYSVTAIAWFALVIGLGLVVMGDYQGALKADKIEKANNIHNTRLLSNGFLSTVKHDGHLFIVNTKGGVIHHPDCPCLKK